MTSTPNEATDPPGPWLTREQAARRLQVSLDTVDRAIGAGELRVRRIGRTVRIHVDDVDAHPGADMMTRQLGPIAGGGLYVVQYPDHVKIGQSAELGYRTRNHRGRGGGRFTIAPCAARRTDELRAIERRALALAMAEPGAVRLGRTERFRGLPYERAVEIIRSVTP